VEVLPFCTRDYPAICTIVVLLLGLLSFSNIETCVGLSLVAKFTFSPVHPKVFESVIFNASESYDPDGFIFSYTWDFGDGNITTVSIPIITHCFSESGDYDVSLTIKDNACYLGLTDSTVETICVNPLPIPPVADFTWTPSRPQTDELVLFDASGSTPNNGTIVSYAWSFGDGVTHIDSKPNATHVYESFGNYTVTLNITDSEGESGIATTTIWVVELPIADFFFEPATPRVCTVLTFDASISNPRGGYIISYEWDFGDGSAAEFGMVVTHRFLNMDDPKVSLNVTDSEGEWNMKTLVLSILPHIADLNEDGTVNILDLTVFAISFGSFQDHGRWNPRADLDGNGKVNILDGVVISRSYNMCIDPFDC
jgi:PKD repeat protein